MFQLAQGASAGLSETVSRLTTNGAIKSPFLSSFDSIDAIVGSSHLDGTEDAAAAGLDVAQPAADG